MAEDATLETLADLPVAALTAQLTTLSGGHLRDVAEYAAKVHQVAAESFALPAPLAQAAQHILTATLAHITFLEGQIAQADTWIAAALPAEPGIPQLATVPSYGPVYSAGIGAEIGGVARFLAGGKWDAARGSLRPRNRHDAEDAIAKIAGL